MYNSWQSIDRLVFRGDISSWSKVLVDRKRNGNRIVGGTDALLGDAPYQVAIWDFSLNAGFPFCGGVILNKYYILTAAHCAVVASPLTTRIDYNRLVTTPLTVSVYGVRISQVIINSAFNPTTFDNDIALIKLLKPLRLGQPQARAVTLPAQGSDPTPGTSVQVTGWGLTSQNGVQTNTLQKVTLTIVNRAVCQADYSGINPVTDNMVCAGVPGGGKDACNGDSGGPMTSNGVLLGIVSWGEGCALPNFPGVFTRVGNYIDWIMENMQCFDLMILRICVPINAISINALNTV